VLPVLRIAPGGEGCFRSPKNRVLQGQGVLRTLAPGSSVPDVTGLDHHHRDYLLLLAGAVDISLRNGLRWQCVRQQTPTRESGDGDQKQWEDDCCLLHSHGERQGRAARSTRVDTTRLLYAFSHLADVTLTIGQ
jgi:hypothetical protein